MNKSQLVAAATIALAAMLAAPGTYAQDVPTDAVVLRALAEMQVPSGRQPPTLKEFRALRTMDGTGRVRPATLDEFRINYEWELLPYELAQKYYPKVLTSLDLPDGLTLAFLMKDRSTVLKHASAAVQGSEGTSLVQTLERIIPGTHLPGQVEQGSQCFAPMPGKHARFCVIYALVP